MPSTLACALSIGCAWLAVGCVAPKKGVLGPCSDAGTCAAGYACDPQVSLCCTGGRCPARAGDGIDLPGTRGRGGGLDGTGADSGLPDPTDDGSPGGTAPPPDDGGTGPQGAAGDGSLGVDAGCPTAACQAGDLRCVSGGVAPCQIIAGCGHWGPPGPDATNRCALLIVDDGIGERDLATQCAINLCVTAGVTP